MHTQRTLGLSPAPRPGRLCVLLGRDVCQWHRQRLLRAELRCKGNITHCSFLFRSKPVNMVREEAETWKATRLGFVQTSKHSQSRAESTRHKGLPQAPSWTLLSIGRWVSHWRVLSMPQRLGAAASPFVLTHCSLKFLMMHMARNAFKRWCPEPTQNLLHPSFHGRGLSEGLASLDFISSPGAS